MALQVTSYAISFSVPSDPKVGESVDIKVSFSATVDNDGQGGAAVELRGSVAAGTTGKANRQAKTAHFGPTLLSTEVQLSTSYPTPGWFKVEGQLVVYDGDRWVTILDKTEYKEFNVLP